MTGDGSDMGTIVPSSVVYTNFVEGGNQLWRDFVLSWTAQTARNPGDGSEWLFFTVPEPSVAAFCLLGGVAALFARRRRNVVTL